VEGGAAVEGEGEGEIGPGGRVSEPGARCMVSEGLVGLVGVVGVEVVLD
jgi:hypothetical protein